MLVMDIPFERMKLRMNSVQGRSDVYIMDKSDHWEFYMDTSSNIVLRSKVMKEGGEQDAMFISTIPRERLVQVFSVVWGMHVQMSPQVVETREEMLSVILSDKAHNDDEEDVIDEDPEEEPEDDVDEEDPEEEEPEDE